MSDLREALVRALAEAAAKRVNAPLGHELTTADYWLATGAPQQDADAALCAIQRLGFDPDTVRRKALEEAAEIIEALLDRIYHNSGIRKYKGGRPFIIRDARAFITAIRTLAGPEAKG